MSRPSVPPAMVIALIALAVALGGTGYAVTQLPKNSVGTAQLKQNAVTGAKVKDASLTARDFRPGALMQGPAGAAGPQGATGAAGATGAPGPAGPQGEPGPTFAFTDSQVLGTPVDITFLTTAISHTVAIPRAGTLTGTATDTNSVAGDTLMTLAFGYAVPAAGSYTLNVICTRYQLTGSPTLGLDRYDITGVLTGA